MGAPKYEISPVNSDAWETHACYSSDNRILYFVSDRPGGFGGRDIYKCLKLPNGKWGPAQNLGDTINTKYDEDGVFIHPDGKQIFFSSKGHNSMGGFDIFTSYIDNENGFWSTPVNYGYPVNTTDDDVFLITSPDGRRAFFSSDQVGGYGEKDIYMIQFPDYEPRDITILVGKIINNSSEDISNNKIVILNSSKGDTIQVLNANSSTGKFGANLPVGDNYKTNYYVNDKLFFSEMLESPKNMGYRALKRNVPYNGKNTIDSVKSIVPTPHLDTLKLTNVPKKMNHSLVIDTSQVIDIAPPIITQTASITVNEITNESVSVGNTDKKCETKNTSFTVNFRYNKKEIDIKSKDYISFINEACFCFNAKTIVNIEMESSASTVPTRTYKTNENLAKMRAEAAREKVLSSLLKRGIKQSQIIFAEPIAKVHGPDYKKDAKKNRSVYEKYQYIKINLSLKND